MTNILIVIAATENTISSLTYALSRLAKATTKHSLSRKTFYDTKQAMKVIGTFVLTPAAAVRLEECLRDFLDRITGEDILKGSMLDNTTISVWCYRVWSYYFLICFGGREK